MAQKNNIRSIRISDQMAELIEQQAGQNFTEKWENLVTRCVWELPRMEEQLQQLEAQIKAEEKRLREFSRSVRDWRQSLQNIAPRIMALETALDEELKYREL